MSEEKTTRATAVLVVGGGPVGLSLAIRLAQFDVPVLLVERHRDTAVFPKGRALSVRTMEIYRSWGLERAVTAAGLPRDHLAFYTGRSLTDPDGARIVTDPGARPLPSPTHTLLCSQDRLEPLLRSCAERLLPDRIRFGTELVELAVTGSGVSALVYDRRGGRHMSITADYLVGCDGAGSGVRRRSQIALAGPSDVSSNLNILFEADLAGLVADRRSAVYTITRPGLHGAFLAVDNDRRWLFNVVDDSDGTRLDRLDVAACRALVRQAAGVPELAVTVVDRQLWRAAAQVADRFRCGPVFLAGDAAHVTTPYGGFGMNCGIADADNLAWKLAAVHHGWADAGLLDTYEAERRPVALASAAESHRRLVDALRAYRAGAPPPVGRPSEGLVLGYRYASTAVLADGTLPPDGDPVADYVPTARPGHRMPHRWLHRDGRRLSTLDLVGPGLTLLAGRDAEWVADPAGVPSEVPLTVWRIGVGGLRDPDAEWHDSYGIATDGAVLVRPDGHVAWRTRRAPAEALGDVVRRFCQRPGPGRPDGVGGPGNRGQSPVG
ncbi:FAD-dependent monooxygenase [Solwaraspora sp. WMMB335]|uniref:FAD-dependent monooxygenase n=1 Tax=Solwaraspora sp. WMMB335 TaxID=3404118 RepID=UPI003B95AFFF